VVKGILTVFVLGDTRVGEFDFRCRRVCGPRNCPKFNYVTLLTLIHYFHGPIDDPFEPLDVLSKSVAFALIVGFHGVFTDVVLEVGGKLHAKLREVNVASLVCADKEVFDIFDGCLDVLETTGF